MFTKTFGSEGEARACEAFLRQLRLKPSIARAAMPERGWVLRVDDSTMVPGDRMEFLDFAHRQAGERQQSLKRRQEEFEKLDLPSLGELWKARDDLEPDETEKLRQVIRAKRGIDGTGRALPNVCPQCHMVGDACTCTRSWF